MFKKVRSQEFEESKARRSRRVGNSSSQVLKKAGNRNRHNFSSNILSKKMRPEKKIAIKKWTARRDYVVEQDVRKLSRNGACVNMMTYHSGIGVGSSPKGE